MFIQSITNQKYTNFSGNIENSYVSRPKKKPNKPQIPQEKPQIPSQPKQDTFEIKTPAFTSVEDSIKVLSKIKDKDGKTKFHQGQLATLEYYIQEEPKKWDSIYSLSKNPELKPDFVYLMASKPLEHLNTLTEVANLKDKKGNSKYTGKEIMNFTNSLTKEELVKAMPLTKTQLSAKNIVMLAQTPNMPKFEKVADKVVEMENLAGNKLSDIQFTLNKFDRTAYVITANMSDKSSKSELLDKNLNRSALEDLTGYKSKNGKEYIVKKTIDYRNNTTSKVRLREDKSVGRPVFENEVRIVKDKNGKVNHYEYISPSKVSGVFDITYKTPEGKEKIVSSGTIDKKSGIISVKKDMTSPEGVRTQYLYENDPQGNRIVDYKITDKNGKLLLNKSQTFEIINENKFISSNGQDKYEINVDEKTISVQNLKNKKEKATFNADKDFLGDKKMLMNTLKQFPGEKLIKLRETVDTLQSINDPLDSYYNGSSKQIHTGGDGFLLLHELGHAIDFKDVDGVSNDRYEKTLYKSITMDKEVNKAFNEEKAAFFAKYPEAQREHIAYFMDTLTHYNGESGGLGETIAESNALLTSAKSYEPLAIRSQYLQQNFPRTIAILDKKLS